MSTLTQQNSTWAQIEAIVRELTACPYEQQLKSSTIQEIGNTFYNSDFPCAIKTDLLRNVYTFYTQPYIDRYPLDVNYNQGVRAPFYVDGYEGTFFKDRKEFFSMWPKWPTKFQPLGLTQGTITGITNADPASVTSIDHGLSTGDNIYIADVVGMTNLNGDFFTITVTGTNTFTLNNVDSTSYPSYTSGGTWSLSTLTFTIPGPFLSNECTYGVTGIAGDEIIITDDGNGSLYRQVPNAVTSVPDYGATYQSGSQIGSPIPGLYNKNTLNPGLNKSTYCGTVDYVSGVFVINFQDLDTIPDPSATPNIWVSQYNTGRPYSIMFWNNEFTIRPVPKLVHKLTIETYLTPVAFMNSTDSPILNQWTQYIGYGISCEVLRRRQDVAGVQNLMEGFKRQEQLVLERQATEEIGSRNVTIFASSQGNGNGWNNQLYGSGWW